MTRGRFSRAAAAAVILALVASACAHGLSLKQQATTALQANEAALKTARVTELDFYNSHTLPAYTATAHLKFIDALDKAQQAEQLAARALQAWTPCSKDTTPCPPPPDAAGQYQAATREVLAVLAALGLGLPPQGTAALRAAEQLVAEAQKLIDTIRGRQ